MGNCPTRKTGSRRAVIYGIGKDRNGAPEKRIRTTAGQRLANAFCSVPPNFKFTMAYMSQDRKANLAPAIKAHCRKFGIKASIAVRHHSTLVVNIKSGKLDLCGNFFSPEAIAEYSRKFPHSPPLKAQNYLQVNPYWAHEHFTGKCREFIVGLLSLMNIGNHDNSDIMTDYFDVGWYCDVNVGSWNKPYQVIK